MIVVLFTYFFHIDCETKKLHDRNLDRRAELRNRLF